jgi:hypothetical protein
MGKSLTSSGDNLARSADGSTFPAVSMTAIIDTQYLLERKTTAAFLADQG